MRAQKLLPWLGEVSRSDGGIEEQLILGLRAAIGYKRAEDRLYIVTEDERSVLTLNRVATGLVEGDDGRIEAFAPPPDDRPAPNPNDALTNHSDAPPDPNDALTNHGDAPPDPNGALAPGRDDEDR